MGDIACIVSDLVLILMTVRRVAEWLEKEAQPLARDWEGFSIRSVEPTLKFDFLRWVGPGSSSV